VLKQEAFQRTYRPQTVLFRNAWQKDRQNDLNYSVPKKPKIGVPYLIIYAPGVSTMNRYMVNQKIKMACFFKGFGE